MQRKHCGFTIIEIMIVIGIIGVLLIIAVPVYLQYSTRTKVTECLSMQMPVRMKISEAAIDDRAMPFAEDVPLSRTTDYCDRGQYVRESDDSATVIVPINEIGVGAPGGDVIEARLEARRCANNDVEWSCYYASAGGDSTQGRYLPVSCRTTVVEFSDSCF